MKNNSLFILILLVINIISTESFSQQIIADHTVVDKYNDIPQFYINKVKEMWVTIPGESHSSGYRIGCQLLASIDAAYNVNVTEGGTPEAYTNEHLRLSRATWGDISNATGWRYGYGEEDWYTSSLAKTRTKDHITYCNNNNLTIAAMGFGWCWDMTWNTSPGGTIDPDYQVRWAGSSVGGPQGNIRWGLDANDSVLTGNSVSMETYLNTTIEYMDHCTNNGYQTKIFFTTGPVDGGGNMNENGYQRNLKHEYIRNFVQSLSNGILFDYADILCWSDAGIQNTTTWTDYSENLQTFQYIHSDNMLDMDGTYAEDGDHIGERGAVRLAKALWWLLARMAGWDGEITVNAKVYLEGPFTGSMMNTDVNTLGALPLSQPYNISPWNYSGVESVNSIPNANVVDWVLIELRDTPGGAATATPATRIAQQAGFILNDGSIVSSDGISNMIFGVAVSNNLYVIVWHRNHLGIMSAVPLTFGGGLYSYDFTTAASKAYLSGQQNLGGGNYGMYAGDADGNGEVHLDDIDLRWSTEVGGNGYFGGDMDMDSDVNNQDKNDVWLPNNTLIDQVPD